MSCSRQGQLKPGKGWRSAQSDAHHCKNQHDETSCYDMSCLPIFDVRIVLTMVASGYAIDSALVLARMAVGQWNKITGAGTATGDVVSLAFVSVVLSEQPRYPGGSFSNRARSIFMGVPEQVDEVDCSARSVRSKRQRSRGIPQIKMMAICGDEPSADETCLMRDTTYWMTNKQISFLGIEAYDIGERVVARCVIARGVSIHAGDNGIILREMRRGRWKEQSKDGYDQGDRTPE